MKRRQARRPVPLRRLFLSPAAAVMGALFIAPLGVVLLYSFLNRGVYGVNGRVTPP